MTVEEIAKLLQGEVQGDARLEITGVASVEAAGPSDLTFAADSRALAQAVRSSAGCILIPPGSAVPTHTVVAVAQPKLAFIKAAEALAPPAPRAAEIHSTAVVDPGAVLGPGVSIGPHAVIESGVRIGARTHLAAGVYAGAGVAIGEDCVLYPGVKLYPYARIGKRVVLHAGVVIGGDGFGYVFAEGRHRKFPQLGRVIIEDDVEIGCNSTVDRGSLGTTVIGEGTKIDNLVQIAHNVRVGKHCVIAAQTGISGSVNVGDYAVIGGQVGIGDHVEIEAGATIASKGGILPGKIVRRGSVLWGIPGRPLDVFKRQYAHLSRLPELARRVRVLERRLSAGPNVDEPSTDEQPSDEGLEKRP